jgi:hypothetical protein
MYVPANDTLYIRIFFNNTPQSIRTNKTINIGFQNPTLNRGVMNENDRWVLFRLGKTFIEPRRPCLANLPPGGTRHNAIHGNQTNIVALNYIIHKTLDRGWAGMPTKRSPKDGSVVVIAGDDVKRVPEFAQQTCRPFGFFRKACIGDIPRHQHQVRLWVELIYMIDTASEVLRSRRDAICFLTPTGDVGITNLCD